METPTNPVRFTDPLVQGHRVDPEVGRDLLERHAVFASLGDAYNVVAELLGVGLGHSNILPGQPRRASQIRCHLSVHQARFKVLATAILDRFLHHCEVIAINGPSYWLKYRADLVSTAEDPAP